jgi:hypothetical protein
MGIEVGPAPIQSGLTPEEQLVSDALVDAWNKFMGLRDSIAIEEQQDFRKAIHDAQHVLMNRIVRRLYPGYWR